MRMMQADLSATIERNNAAFERLRADMAQRDAARSERDATARWWQTAILIAALGIGLTVYGFLTVPH